MVDDAVANHVSVAYASGGAAGSKTLTVTLGATAATRGQYSDGWLAVIDGTGSGQVRKIRDNPAADASATLELTLYDTIETSVSGAEVSLVQSMYANIQRTPGDSAQPVLVGVPQFDCPTGASTTQYLWVQTWGEGMVVGDNSTFTAGALLVAASAGTGDAGQVVLGVDGTNTFPEVGQLIQLGDADSDGDFRFANFRIRA